MGHHLIMGRKTYQSIGKPLPGRTMIVLTRNLNFQADGCLVENNLEGALAMAKGAGENEVFIAGGAEIFSQVLGIADRIYLTRVHAVVQADTFFPHFDKESWVVISSIFYGIDARHRYPFTIELLTR
jgi:dihydrofolate reductase